MERRFRLSGVIKFSDEHLIFENQDQAKRSFKDIYLEVGGLNMNAEMIEEKIEDLGPGSWDEDVNYITTCKCEDCETARMKTPEQVKKIDDTDLHIKMAWDYLNKAFEGAEDKEKLLDNLTIWIEGARLEQKVPVSES